MLINHTLNDLVYGKRIRGIQNVKDMHQWAGSKGNSHLKPSQIVESSPKIIETKASKEWDVLVETDPLRDNKG
jgi:hypothetical protein